jgi:hypothetical protein
MPPRSIVPRLDHLLVETADTPEPLWVKRAATTVVLFAIDRQVAATITIPQIDCNSTSKASRLSSEQQQQQQQQF